MKRFVTAALAVLASSTVLADKAPASWRDPVTGMSFVSIDKGCYQMGTAEPVAPHPDPFWQRIGYKAALSHDEQPRHEVCVDAFWMGEHEVTADEWKAVMGGGSGGKAPVARVSWEQARIFAARLSERSGVRYRLPTEAEWEYACRAGAAEAQTVISLELVGQAWYSRGEARRDAPEPVGQLAANAFGLHDMLGNVWEWTEDSYRPDAYARHALYNPVVREAAGQKVIRGGSFRTEPRQTRCTARGHIDPDQTLDAVGFRLVRVR